MQNENWARPGGSSRFFLFKLARPIYRLLYSKLSNNIEILEINSPFFVVRILTIYNQVLTDPTQTYDIQSIMLLKWQSISAVFWRYISNNMLQSTAENWFNTINCCFRMIGSRRNFKRSYKGLVIYDPAVGGGRIQINTTKILDPPLRARKLWSL